METRLIYCVVCNRVGQRRPEHSCFCASCPPCFCGDDAARLELERVRRENLAALVREAEEDGLYEATDRILTDE